MIYDPATHALEGLQLVEGRYVPIPPDDGGAIEVAILGIRLGVRDTPLSTQCGPPCLRWLDAGGSPLPGSLDHAATAARARDGQRDAEERAEAERQRAEAERQRAEAERQRADAERRRAEAA